MAAKEQPGPGPGKTPGFFRILTPAPVFSEEKPGFQPGFPVPGFPPVPR